MKSFFHRVTHWEYWPTFMFYYPLLPYAIFKAIQARNPIFFLATNPAILYSGSGTESKFQTISLIPEKYKPKTILIDNNSPINDINNKIAKNDICFPLIVKPDIGFRGYLVKKINNENELREYFQKINIPTIIQEFIDFEHEIGVFYHRIPGEIKGKITSITVKKNLKLKGDGDQSLSSLILNHDRAFLYYDLFKIIHKEKLHKIPIENEEITLSVIGNHSKGSQFLDGAVLINADLERVFDQLNHQIKGWYYGRVDLKYQTFESLCMGQGFKIIEINGIISEPTHIYDASSGATYFDALKALKSHWGVLSKIAVKNHQQNNVAYPKFLPYLKNIIQLKKQANLLQKLSKL